MTNHNVFKDTFTPAEEQVLKLLIKGYTNKEIADFLCVSYSTVKTHIYNIYSKSGISKRITQGCSVMRLRVALKYLDRYKD